MQEKSEKICEKTASKNSRLKPAVFMENFLQKIPGGGFFLNDMNEISVRPA